MTYMNRRNAATGWLTLAVGRYILRRKAKSNRGRWAAVAALIAAVVGAAVFWKKRSGNELAGAGAPLPPVVPTVAGETGDDGPPDETPVAGPAKKVNPKG
jgi:hypothetical protein